MLLEEIAKVIDINKRLETKKKHEEMLKKHKDLGRRIEAALKKHGTAGNKTKRKKEDIGIDEFTKKRYKKMSHAEIARDIARKLKSK